MTDSPASTHEQGVTEDRPQTATWWAILAGLSSWSYMAVWSANAQELAGFFPSHFFVWLLLLLIVGAAIQRAFLAVLRGPSRVESSLAVAAVILILLQSWNSSLTAEFGLMARLAIHVVLMLVVVTILLRLVPAFPHIRAVFGVVTVFLVGVPYLILVGELWGSLSTPHLPQATTAAVSTLDDSPDVFVVVLDEYTSNRVLEDEFDHDNTGFEESLSSAGLTVVQGAKSNYTNTLLSVAGLLTGRYPAIGGPMDTTYSDLIAIHSGDNSLFASLEASGYETHLFDNAWTFTRCGSNVDVCHNGGLNELDWLVAQRTPFFDLVPWLQLSPWIRGSLTQFEEVTRVAGSAPGSPRLVYLHALVPHAPLQLADDCSLALPGLGSLEGVDDSPDARSAYSRQVECVNALVMNLIQAVPNDAIVFVTGDHGVRWASVSIDSPGLAAADAANTLGILTAYRFPAGCESIPSQASLQRSIARLFECLGIEPEVDAAYSSAQSDRYFTQSLGRDGVYDVTEVTEQVDGNAN